MQPVRVKPKVRYDASHPVQRGPCRSPLVPTRLEVGAERRRKRVPS